MKQDVTQRVEALRHWMRQRGIQAFIVPSTDPHASEYVPQHWTTRQWISGFTGSAGTAVITLDQAALWTDSRYYLQAGEQLGGTPFTLMRDGQPDTPSITQWLSQVLQAQDVVGFDAAVNTQADGRAWRKELQRSGIGTQTSSDPAETLWTDRPPLPHSTIAEHPMQYAGESVESKLARLRQKMHEEGAEALLITQLDEIAWLTNLRGGDVHCTPVFIAYMLVTPTHATLYAASETPRSEAFDVKPYAAITTDLQHLTAERIMADPATCNCALWHAIPEGCTIIETPSPIARIKAVKNECEIAGFRQAMLHEGVAMVRLLMWLERNIGREAITEMSLDAKLTQLRQESDAFIDLSFDTIAAYGEHAAIVHYEATPETDIALQPRGFLLLDCGGQYVSGTTDITRTIPLGELTEEERRDYTLVLKGHLRLAMARFPEGTAGTQLDALARYAMWQEGINFGHGTGHGVGARLSVHEGPHQIRMQWRPAPLQAGMTVTNEPGIYRAGRHGIRIENTMLVVSHCQTEFGRFLALEPLTLCPIDLRPVIADMLLPDEKEYLRQYHNNVYATLAPHLNEEERAWMQQLTTI